MKNKSSKFVQYSFTINVNSQQLSLEMVRDLFNIIEETKTSIEELADFSNPSPPEHIIKHIEIQSSQKNLSQSEITTLQKEFPDAFEKF